MDNIKTCHVKSPKNYYIVRFVLSLVRHAGEGIIIRFLECVELGQRLLMVMNVLKLAI